MELPEAVDPKVTRIIRVWEPVALALAGLLAVVTIATWPMRFPEDPVIAGGWLRMPIETAIGILLSTVALATQPLARAG